MTMMNPVDSKAAVDLVVQDPNAEKVTKYDEEIGQAPDSIAASIDKEKIAEDAQPGVQKIEAVTLAWGRGSLYIVLGLYVFLHPRLIHDNG